MEEHVENIYPRFAVGNFILSNYTNSVLDFYGGVRYAPVWDLVPDEHAPISSDRPSIQLDNEENI